MFDKNWKPTHTWPERYDEIGVTDRVAEYLELTGKRNLVILDIGCSTAIATRKLKQMLENMGIKVQAIGVDLATTDNIPQFASKNLDVFLNHDLKDVYPALYQADIVICTNMVYYLSATKRAETIRQCAQFMKDDAVLITNTRAFDRPSNYAAARQFFSDYKPILFSIIHGPRALYRQFNGIKSMRFKRMMYAFHGRIEAEQYASKIITTWKLLSGGEKFGQQCDMFNAYINSKFRRWKPVNQPKKKRF